jgi:uncharacterized protein (DUF58 family)
VLVYPALRDVQGIIDESAGSEGGVAVMPTGTGEEMYSLREYRYGDDWRRIHWKASAKTSDLLVREYAEYSLKKATVLIDNLAADSRANVHAANREAIVSDVQFEEVVSLSGSVARYFLERGYLVRVLSCRKVIPFGMGDEHLFKILDILALLGEEDGWDSPVSEEKEGVFISLLRSPHTALNRYVPLSDMVIYADTL